MAVRSRSPAANAASSRSATARALSTAWPLAAISSRISARAASAAGPAVVIATSRSPAGSRSEAPAATGSLAAASTAAAGVVAAPVRTVAARFRQSDVEHAHRDLVPPSSVAPDRLARATLDHEPATLVGAHGPDR